MTILLAHDTTFLTTAHIFSGAGLVTIKSKDPNHPITLSGGWSGGEANSWATRHP